MYYADTPIAFEDQDLLNRYGFSKLLAQALINMKTSDTYTVGLFGKWGSGKTSLVNMAIQELEETQAELPEKERFTIVHFEPWNFSDTNQLVSQFLIHLSNEFKTKTDQNLSNVGKALEKYAGAFDFAEAIPHVGKLVAFLGKHGMQYLSGKLQKDSNDKDIMKQKDFVIDLLSKQNHKILVIIDDIDRLSDVQIRQVFQLITAVAKFPNTVYLLVFDKDVVVKALEKVQEGKGNEYLEKIIQMPIQIPEAQQSAIHKVLFDRLDVLISQNKEIHFSKESWQQIFPVCISPEVNSLRLVNRLINVLQFKFAAIASEVDFADMVAISLLEINHPEIYEWVKSNKNLFTKGNDIWDEYGLKDKTYSECLNIIRTWVEEVLQRGKDEPVLRNDVEQAIDFLSMLFPCFGQKINKRTLNGNQELLMRENKIGHPEKFDRYFALDLNGAGVKSGLITDVVYNSDSTSIAGALLALCKVGHCYGMLEEISARRLQLSSGRAKILASALLQVAYQLDETTTRESFWIGTEFRAGMLICDLIAQIVFEERMSFLSDVIQNADADSMVNVSNVINSIGLSYGKYSAEGEERQREKLITLEQLLELEQVFLGKMKALLEDQCLFDFSGWSRMRHLLEYVDSAYIADYLSSQLSNNVNILKFARGYISTVYGTGGKGYSVNPGYEKYITKEKIVESLKAQIENGEILSLPETVQTGCAVFYLDSMGKGNPLGTITQKSVDEMISAWSERKESI